MKWQEIVRQLHALHEMRKDIQHASNYHGSYVEEAIRLNTQLKKEIGMDYCDLPTKMIQNCLSS